MNDVQLITVDDIKEITSISKNIDAQLLEPYIMISEEYYVYSLLGTGLTIQLKDQLTANTLTSLNQTLLISYIRPLASYGAWLEASPFLNFKTVGKGVVKQSSDNSTNVDLEELSFYRQALKDKVTFWQERLKTYLEDKKDSYPLYESSCSSTGDYNSIGVYLGSND